MNSNEIAAKLRALADSIDGGSIVVTTKPDGPGYWWYRPLNKEPKWELVIGYHIAQGRVTFGAASKAWYGITLNDINEWPENPLPGDWIRIPEPI